MKSSAKTTGGSISAAKQYRGQTPSIEHLAPNILFSVFGAVLWLLAKSDFHTIYDIKISN